MTQKKIQNKTLRLEIYSVNNQPTCLNLCPCYSRMVGTIGITWELARNAVSQTLTQT